MKHTKFIIILSLQVSIVHICLAQSPGDFRSRQSGTWHIATSWQTYDGTNWVNATTIPSYANGTITILSGHTITSNVADTADQVVINSGGTLSITAGTFTVADGAGTDLDGNGTISLSNGTLTGAGTIALNTGSLFNWSGGINGGSGTININAGAVCNLTGGTNLADTKTINNYGTWNWTGSTFYYYNGSPTVNNYGTFNIYTDADVVRNNATTGTFNNMPTGIINKIGSPSEETYFNDIRSFSNAGTINVNSSRLRLNVGSSHSGAINIAFGANMAFSSAASFFNAGTAISGDGTLSFESGADTINAASISVSNFTVSGATVYVGPALTISSGDNLNLANGTLTGPGTITLNPGGTFNWSGGFHAGSGITNIIAGAVCNVTGGANLADTRIINNYGTWNWTGSTFYYYNGSPAINNYGTFNIYTDADVVRNNATTGTFNNMPTGIINKIGSPSEETYFNDIKSFSNAGTINVNSSRLRLNTSSVHSGTINIAFAANMAFSTAASIFNTGTAFAGEGSVNFEGGNDTIYAASFAVNSINITNGLVDVSPSITMNAGSTLNLSGGTLTGAGTITFNPGSLFNWSGGINGGTGIMNINAGAVCNITGGANLADTKTFNNYGTWNWTGNVFYYYNGSPAVNNYGTFNINTDADVAQYNSTTGTFNNMPTGVINKIGSSSEQTAFSSISAFTNSGTININSGNLALNVGGTHSGTYKIAFGAQLRGSLNMIFTGPSFINDGSVALTNLSFSGTTSQSLNAEGSINSLAVNNVNGLVLGGSQTINNTLTLSNGKITIGDNNLLLGPSATLTGGSATTYVVTNGHGYLQRRVSNNNTNTLFPVGLSNTYMPVNVQLTAASIADNFAVRLQPNLYGGYDSTNGNTIGTGINANSVNGSWFISEGTPGGSSATITFQWNAANEAPGFNRAVSRFGQYKGNTWSLDPATIAASGANPYTISRSALTSFQVFGVTNQFVASMNNYAVFCSGSTVSIPYAAIGTFNAGNIFTAQLSDSTGSYAAPITIGSVAATASGSINATIPNTALSGTGYRIRILSSAPALVSPDNPSIIPIRACAATPPLLTKNVPVKVNVSNITVTGALVSWDKVSAATAYEVQYKPAFAAGWSTAYTTIENVSMNTLQPATPYEVRVRTQTGSGYSDFTEAQLFTTLQTNAGSDNTALPAGKLSIYPNPTYGQFVLAMRVEEVETGTALMQIINTAGQVVHKETIPVSAYQLNKTISFHPSTNAGGIYFITIRTGGRLYHGKIHYRQ